LKRFEKCGTSATWSKTFEFTDTYILDGTRRQQQLVRTVRRPDIVFSARDLGPYPNSVFPVAFVRSSPNWTVPERDASQAGPGTLQGSVTITFAKMGVGYINEFPGYTTEGSVIGGRFFAPFKWGWFNGSIAPIISFPIGVAQGFPSVLRVEENIPESPDLIFWNLSGYPNVEYTIESSVDLRNWSEYQRVSSPSGGYSFTTSKTTNEPVRFFRVSSRAGF